MYLCVCVRVRTSVYNLTVPRAPRSWNTSVALARFIKNPGYRPAVKIEAAYLLHFVQINLKTCESYSSERLGKEVNNIRLILTSHGRERTKIQEVLLLRGLHAHPPQVGAVGPHSPATVPTGWILALVSF